MAEYQITSYTPTGLVNTVIREAPGHGPKPPLSAVAVCPHPPSRGTIPMDSIPTTLDPDFDDLEPWDVPEAPHLEDA